MAGLVTNLGDHVVRWGGTPVIPKVVLSSDCPLVRIARHHTPVVSPVSTIMPPIDAAYLSSAHRP